MRGTKLLALFTGLNIVAQFVRSPAYGRSIGLENFFQAWDEIYVFGEGRLAVFEVLLPIAYLLLLAPALIWADRLHRSVLPALAVLSISISIVCDQLGETSSNLNLLGAGVLGMLAGRLIADPARLGRRAFALLAVYALCYPLEVAYGFRYAVQLVSACLALLAICAICVRIGERGWLQQRLLRLGRHSLFAYVAQIGILQTLSRFTGRPDPLSPEWAGLFFVTLGLTVMLVETVEWIRPRVRLADRTYSAVFA
jgi:hypothetical protein